MSILKLSPALLILPLLFSSCAEGPTGPPGPRGSDGQQGPQGEPGESAFVLEYQNVNFTSPEYEVLLPFGNFESYPSDAILVYFLYGSEEVDGEMIDVWKQVPNTEFTEDGILEYDYDFTIYDVRLFMEADFPLDWLTAIHTDNWIVRVVVVPGNFVDSKVDFSDYYAVKEAFGLPDMTSHHIESRK